MCRTGRSLREWMGLGAAGVVALAHFARHLDADSATSRELSTYQGWDTTTKTNAMLADLYDGMAALLWTYQAAHSKRKPPKPKPYPRPWAKHGKRLGRDPIRASEFDKWWKSKE